MAKAQSSELARICVEFHGKVAVDWSMESKNAIRCGAERHVTAANHSSTFDSQPKAGLRHPIDNVMASGDTLTGWIASMLDPGAPIPADDSV